MQQILVFGSNLAGRHGKGAALHAKLHWGAEYGVGEGPTGDSYALPTKDHKLRVRSLEDIDKSIQTFLDYARGNLKKLFLFTPVGTGLAGYSKKQIATLLTGHHIPDNVVFTHHWFESKSYDARLG